MYKHILIATDGSELAQRAVEQGLELAKAIGAKASVVTVTEAWTTMVAPDLGVSFPIEEYEQSCAANAGRILKIATDRAKALGVPCEAVYVKDQFPADGVIETAKKSGCDLIVMASHGRRGLSRLLLGSQTNRVLTHSAIPVLVVR